MGDSIKCIFCIFNQLRYSALQNDDFKQKSMFFKGRGAGAISFQIAIFGLQEVREFF